MEIMIGTFKNWSPNTSPYLYSPNNNPVFTPATSEKKPIMKTEHKKSRNPIFFSSCVHTNNEKDNTSVKGVDRIKKSVWKKSIPTKPIQWKKRAIAVAIWYFEKLFITVLVNVQSGWNGRLPVHLQFLHFLGIGEFLHRDVHCPRKNTSLWWYL